jgi:hypothetical protein
VDLGRSERVGKFLKGGLKLGVQVLPLVGVLGVVTMSSAAASASLRVSAKGWPTSDAAVSASA